MYVCMYVGKRNVEKWLLRKAFDGDIPGQEGSPWLPREVLWRMKEAFSDGLSLFLSLSLCVCVCVIRKG